METAATTRKIGEYTLGPMLGKGAFGRVRLATKDGDSTPSYAIKYMKVGKPYTKEYLIRTLQEEAIQQTLNHPNILRVYATNTEGVYEKVGAEAQRIHVVYVVLQLARSGDLFDFVASFGGLSESMARFYFLQILNALEYLHSNGIVHRDMKPENVLLDQNYNALLTDFGMCKKLSEVGFTTDKPTHRVGTERCMSPELFAGLAHSPVKDDLFALGYLLFMLVAKHPPFMAATITNEHYKQFKENRVLEYWQTMDAVHKSKWCSDDFKHLITLMLTYEMSIRPSIAEIKAHPWLQGELPTEAAIFAEFESRQRAALEFQRKEAQNRKERKAKIAEDVKKPGAHKKQKQGLAPHLVKRAVKEDRSIPPVVEVNKVLEEFGEVQKHKPTVLMSQESPQAIEASLIAFFAVNETVHGCKEKYKFRVEYEAKKGLVISIKIYAFDKETNCIEIERVSGDAVDFIDAYNKIQEYVYEEL